MTDTARGPEMAADEGKKRYLVFERGAHSLVYFVRGKTTTEAIWNFVAEQNDDAALQADGSIIEDGTRYAHPLAFIEARYKAVNEWQIREMPGWAWEDDFAEMFCGESADGPPSVIEDCREHFARDVPGARAKAFLWYLKEGALVTFYRKKRFQISVLRRYLWDWDGDELTIEEWNGGYEQIVAALQLQVPRWHSSRQNRTPYRLPSGKTVLEHRP